MSDSQRPSNPLASQKLALACADQAEAAFEKSYGRKPEGMSDSTWIAGYAAALFDRAAVEPSSEPTKEALDNIGRAMEITRGIYARPTEPPSGDTLSMSSVERKLTPGESGDGDVHPRAPSSALPPVVGWQPIETAPPCDRDNPVYVAYPHFKDANRTMVPDFYTVFTAYRDNLGWDTGFWRLHEVPHYWHPLPSAPTTMRDGAEIKRHTETKSAEDGT